MLFLSRRTKLPALICYASSLLHSSNNSLTSAFHLQRATSLQASRYSSTITTTTTRMSSSSSPRAVVDIVGKTIVSVPDAISLHSSDNVKFIDGSWFLMNRNGREEYLKGPRIKGAQFFDIDDIATPSHLPHMMPPKKLFEAAMDAMGISNDDHIIVYGSKDCMFVHRAWFQIRNMGHGKDYCHLMDGSFADWMEQEGPVEEGEPSIPIINSKDLNLEEPTKYKATDAQNIVDLQEMKDLVIKDPNDVDAIWVDARNEDRFFGRVEEPRPGMRLGHMPNGKNLFFLSLLNPENVNKLKPKEELEKIFANAGIDLSTKKRIIASCGSGATACTIIAALDVCGIPPEQCYVYDGSWSEWGGLDDTPIVKEDNK